MFSIGLVLWLIYGIIIHSTPVIVAMRFTLVLALAIVVLKIRYSAFALPQPDMIPGRP